MSTPRSPRGADHAAKIGPDGRVALRPDTADGPRAVVEVEVGGQGLRPPPSVSLHRAEVRGWRTPAIRRSPCSSPPHKLEADRAPGNEPRSAFRMRITSIIADYAGGVVGGAGGAVP